MAPPAIRIDRLGHVHEDGTLALHEISLHIGPGEAIAVVGADGAGKSTLLLHLAGQLLAAQGRVFIGDRVIERQTLAAVRQQVGVVFQDPDDQLFMPTVMDGVAFGPRNQGHPEAEVMRRAQQTLQQMGVWALRNRPPCRLSLGEKRRVAIAGVLAMAPAVLVLDEPSAGLDPMARRELLSLLAARTQTRIFASHDLELVLALCPRTLVRCAGRVMADGATAEVLADEALLARCRLETPAAQGPCSLCRHVPAGNDGPALVPAAEPGAA